MFNIRRRDRGTTGRKIRGALRPGAFAYPGCLGRHATAEGRPRLESQDTLFGGRGKWHFMQSRYNNRAMVNALVTLSVKETDTLVNDPVVREIVAP